MSTETATPTMNPLLQPKMLANIIKVQIQSKSPTSAQLALIVSHITSAYPDADDDTAVKAAMSVSESVVLDDDAKVAILTPIMAAMKSGDFSKLISEDPAGEEQPERPAGRFNPLANRSPVIDVTPEGYGTTPITPSPAAPINGHSIHAMAPVIPVIGEDPASLMARAIQLLQQGAKSAEAAPLDEGRVKELVTEALASHLDNVTTNVSSLFTSLEERMKETFKGSGVHRIEVVHPDGKTIAVEGATHWQFEQILTWLTANVPVWLHGKAGAGKTHLGRQLAQALDIPAYIVSIDPTITVGKLVGYRNLATGEYVPGLLTAAYRDGGLLMLDEIDTGDPGIIACLNSLLANGHYLFPCGNTIARHPKFRVIAGGNTKGTGAVAGYTARQRLDAATLNRFAVVELKYDERLEEVLSIGASDRAPIVWKRANPGSDRCKAWVNWIQKVRSTVGDSVLVSPRASYLGVAAIRAGIPVNEAADALVFALTTSDTQRSITSNCGMP